MKKKNILLICSFVFVLVISGTVSFSNKIITKKINYKSANDNNVSTRELAMLASLVYEDVPSDYNYSYSLFRQFDKDKDKGCLEKNGNLKSNCFFTQSDEKVKYINSNFEVNQYIEGMSERKMKSLISSLSGSTVEDGQKYYFLDLADVSELEKSWSIFDYKTTKIEDNDPDNVMWNNYFDAITFKKDNNYVIAYRGTDFPDLYEWLADIAYAVNGKISQSEYAYNYAQEVYDKILKDNEKAKIYVTGHSLGGYLAQIGGAAIVDKEAGLDIEDANSTPEDSYGGSSARLSSYYLCKYGYGENCVEKNSASHLEQVAYFNGMGVTGIFGTSNFSRNISNALVYLSMFNKDGSNASTGRYVNYSKPNPEGTILPEIYPQSSGRLVLYTIDGDPVSSLGFHYGEIYKLDVAQEAIDNHKNKKLSAVIGNIFSKPASEDDTNIVITKKLNDVIESLKNGNFNEEIITKLTTTMTDTITSIKQTKDIINKVSNIVNNTDLNSDAYPKFVMNVLNKQYGITNFDSTNFGLSNIKNVIKKFATYTSNLDYSESSFLEAGGEAIGNIGSILEYANVNHETDSFMLLKDDSTTTNKVGSYRPNLEVETVNMNCSMKNNKTYCEDLKSYNVPENYSLGDKINYDLKNNQDKYIIVRAPKITNASYMWYVTTNNIGIGSHQPIAVSSENGELNYYTTNNEIILPAAFFVNENNNYEVELIKNQEKMLSRAGDLEIIPSKNVGELELYLGVEIKYNSTSNKFTPLKTNFTSDKLSVLKYQEEASLKNNPTLIDFANGVEDNEEFVKSFTTPKNKNQNQTKYPIYVNGNDFSNDSIHLTY